MSIEKNVVVLVLASLVGLSACTVSGDSSPPPQNRTIVVPPNTTIQTPPQ